MADRAEADLLRAAVGWAVLHPAESVHQAETVHLRSFGDTGIPVAGPGRPVDRIAEPVALRDLSCVFPWCTRPARKLRPDQHPCDNEHVVPYHRGGPTCTCQIAPLCRRHHRLKTHGGWTYHALEPGSYVWTSPHRYQYLRDHTGTLDTSRDRHRCRPPTDDPPPTGET